MDDADRKRILLNIDNLVQYTDYNKLAEICLENELLFIEMIEQFEVNILISNETLYNRLSKSKSYAEPLFCKIFFVNSLSPTPHLADECAFVFEYNQICKIFFCLYYDPHESSPMQSVSDRKECIQREK